MPTLYLPGYDRSEWYRDKDGVWTTVQHTDDVRTHTFDYTDVLVNYGSGVTISTSTWSASGVTTASASATTTTTTIKVTGTGGWIKNTLTLSNSNTHVETYRFRAKPDAEEPSDYGG